MYYHMIAFLAGFLLDLLIGDPHWLYHPVRIIGKLITLFDVFFMMKSSSWIIRARRVAEPHSFPLSFRRPFTFVSGKK